MKTFFTSLILMFYLFSGKTSAQTTYKFIIDKQSYYVEETKLNDYFGLVFNELVEGRRAKQRNFDMWVDSYNKYKQMASSGTFSWEVYYDKIVNPTYNNNSPLVGLKQFSDADMGMDKGKLAKGNPNKKQNHGRRMSYLNGLLSKHITNNYTNKRIK